MLLLNLLHPYCDEGDTGGESGQSTEVSAGADQTPAGTEQKPETATDFLTRSVEEIQSKATEEIPPEGEEKPPEGEQAEEETEEIDEAEMLKRRGFTHKTLDDIKADIDKMSNQTEVFNWLNKNVEGFSDFAYQKMMEARGLNVGEKRMSLKDMGLKQPEKPASAELSSDEVRAKLVDEYGEERISEFEDIMSRLGYAKKGDLDAGIKSYDQSLKAERDAKNARDTFDGFGKSENVKEILTGLNLDWEKDVKKAVTDILLDDFGIYDFANVTEKNIARAFNAFVQEQEGGIEKLLTNAKNEALKTHEDKLKLGKTVPKPGTQTTKPGERTIQQILDDPKTTADDVKNIMRKIEAKRGR